jgi:hypothetical protein
LHGPTRTLVAVEAAGRGKERIDERGAEAKEWMAEKRWKGERVRVKRA